MHSQGGMSAGSAMEQRNGSWCETSAGACCQKGCNLYVSRWFEPESFSYRVDSLLAASPCWENVGEWVLLCVFRAAHDSDTLWKRINPLWLDWERHLGTAGQIGGREGGCWCASQRHNVSSVLRLSVQWWLAWKAACVCMCVSVGWCQYLTGRREILKRGVSGGLYLHPDF